MILFFELYIQLDPQTGFGKEFTTRKSMRPPVVF